MKWCNTVNIFGFDCAAIFIFPCVATDPDYSTGLIWSVCHDSSENPKISLLIFRDTSPDTLKVTPIHVFKSAIPFLLRYSLKLHLCKFSGVNSKLHLHKTHGFILKYYKCVYYT